MIEQSLLIVSTRSHFNDRSLWSDRSDHTIQSDKSNYVRDLPVFSDPILILLKKFKLKFLQRELF